MRKTIARIYLRYNRGYGLVSVATIVLREVVYLGILMDLSWRYLHLKFPPQAIVILVLGAMVFYYILGLLDEKIGFWKTQNDISNRDLTPFFKELEKKIDEINKKI